MTLLLDPIAERLARSSSMLTVRSLARTAGRAAALASAIAFCSSGCKNSEPANAPASEAPSEAAATQPSSAESPSTGSAAAPTTEPASPEAPSIYAFDVKRLDGTATSLSAWQGKVLLIVNTASKCGYTPQYQGLQQLHAKYSARGFEVLGFPSNDFGGQEPGTAEEISNFCISMYDVNFPMFEKTKTTGADRSPLYALLSQAHGEPKWNFHKYLIDKQGKPVQAWPSKVEPGSPEIVSAIEAQLAL
jgi:glutathione peroxidase